VFQVPGTTLNPSRVEVFTSIYPAINYHISFFLSFVGYVGAVPGTRVVIRLTASWLHRVSGRSFFC